MFCIFSISTKSKHTLDLFAYLYRRLAGSGGQCTIHLVCELPNCVCSGNCVDIRTATEIQDFWCVIQIELRDQNITVARNWQTISAKGTKRQHFHLLALNCNSFSVFHCCFINSGLHSTVSIYLSFVTRIFRNIYQSVWMLCVCVWLSRCVKS